jgi:hypothetical protein
LILGGTRAEVQRPIQGIELEVISVRISRRWRRTAVPNLAEVVLSLAGAVGKVFLGRNGLTQLAGGGRQV